MTSRMMEISKSQAPFPKPVVMVGAVVDDRPNFITVAWFNRLNREPNIWGAAIGKTKFTLRGIRENRTFSVNLPSANLVVKTDYCGLRSGREVDKSRLFSIFYGHLKTAPMIGECPICAECSVVDIIDLPTNSLVLGEVKALYANESCMTDGEPDQKKLDLFVFTRPADQYWTLGSVIGDAYSIGNQLVPHHSHEAEL